MKGERNLEDFMNHECAQRLRNVLQGMPFHEMRSAKERAGEAAASTWSQQGEARLRCLGVGRGKDWNGGAGQD